MAKIREKVEALATELPGITYGYIGNVGVDRSGPFDDRSFRIFLPHPGRVGTFADNIHVDRAVGLSGEISDGDWATLEYTVRRIYAERVAR